ncbi:MAG: hypothetical protein KTR31_02590 [Myxococcales bacterium]|nr:hypothetical protein [Myxococcales bacterium]
MWHPADVRNHIWEQGLAQESIEILDVDCDEHPCIVWTLWRGHETSDGEPRSWFPQGDDANALWSHSYTLMFGPHEDGMAIQAFSTAPRHEVELLDQRVSVRVAEQEREMLEAAAAWTEAAGQQK